jgi:hypothetical protein
MPATGDLDQDGIGGLQAPARRTRVHVPAYSGIRAGPYKYVEYADGSEELYNLARDSQELVNLAGHPRYRAAQMQLAAELERLRSCAGLACAKGQIVPALSRGSHRR